MAVLAQILRARASDDPERSAPDRRVEEEWGEERFWAWRTARVVAMDPAAYEAFGLALVEQEDLTPRLGEIACPTAVLVGELDHEFRAPSAALARHIRGAALWPCSARRATSPSTRRPTPGARAVLEHLARVR